MAPGLNRRKANMYRVPFPVAILMPEVPLPGCTLATCWTISPVRSVPPSTTRISTSRGETATTRFSRRSIDASSCSAVTMTLRNGKTGTGTSGKGTPVDVTLRAATSGTLAPNLD